MMKALLFVFLGGGTGSVLRFIASLYWSHLSLHPRYANISIPVPTLIVNIVGAFMIGLFYQYSDRWGLSPETRLLLTTGLCGGFTTFSTFSYEGITLLREGMYGSYALYLTLSIVFGLLAAALPMIVDGTISK